METVSPISLPFLDRHPKKMLIGGEWTAAASGRTFPSVNPSTGEVIAELAEGGPPDADRAVAAARAAFEGPWRRMKPRERQALLWALADAVQECYEELRLLEALDMGSPIGRRRAKPAPCLGGGGAALLRRTGRRKSTGETIPNSMPRPVLSYTVKEPVGVWPPSCPGTARSATRCGRSRRVLSDRLHDGAQAGQEASLVALRPG